MHNAVAELCYYNEHLCINQSVVTFTGYVASASFLDRVCNLVKEVRDHNPSVKFGKCFCFDFSQESLI